MSDYEKQAKRNILIDGINRFNDNSLTLEDVQIVWESKVLQNWKATMIIPKHLDKQIYYEVTYNGDQQEYYLDVYQKIDKHVIRNIKIK